jgi:hypothetical protein
MNSPFLVRRGTKSNLDREIFGKRRGDLKGRGPGRLFTLRRQL